MKFHDSSCQSRPVWVLPVQKSQRQVFSWHGSFFSCQNFYSICTYSMSHSGFPGIPAILDRRYLHAPWKWNVLPSFIVVCGSPQDLHKHAAKKILEFSLKLYSCKNKSRCQIDQKQCSNKENHVQTMKFTCCLNMVLPWKSSRRAEDCLHAVTRQNIFTQNEHFVYASVDINVVSRNDVSDVRFCKPTSFYTRFKVQTTIILMTFCDFRCDFSLESGKM